MRQRLFLFPLVGQKMHKGVDLHMGHPVDGVVVRRRDPAQRRLTVRQRAVVLL